MKKKKENYLKSIDDINYKLYIFERYLSNYPYDVTGIMLKDRYACMLKKVILEYERLFSGRIDIYDWKGKNDDEGISDT